MTEMFKDLNLTNEQVLSSALVLLCIIASVILIVIKSIPYIF